MLEFFNFEEVEIDKMLMVLSSLILGVRLLVYEVLVHTSDFAV